MLSAYQKPYTKALGKDGILVTHENTVMHKCASDKADLFAQTFQNPKGRVDVSPMETLTKSTSRRKQRNSLLYCSCCGVLGKTRVVIQRSP